MYFEHTHLVPYQRSQVLQKKKNRKKNESKIQRDQRKQHEPSFTDLKSY